MQQVALLEHLHDGVGLEIRFNGADRLVSVRVETEAGSRTVAGTVFEGGQPRIVQIEPFDIDLRPSRHMLMMTYPDLPGMVGRIGALLGEADVNISAMHLARSRPREDALMILALDDDVTPGIEEAIRAQESVLDLWTVRLGGDR